LHQHKALGGQNDLHARAHKHAQILHGLHAERLLMYPDPILIAVPEIVNFGNNIVDSVNRR